MTRTALTKKATVARGARGSKGWRRGERGEVEEGDGDLTFTRLAFIHFRRGCRGVFGIARTCQGMEHSTDEM